LTLSNALANTTLTVTGDSLGQGAGYVVVLKDATGGADVFNLVLTKAGLLTAGSVTVANVETVNITTADTTKPPINPPLDTLTLVADKATKVVVSGNAGLDLTGGSIGTAIKTLDASGITKGDFKFTSGAIKDANAIIGSTSGTNTVDMSNSVANATTYTGGTGEDILTITNAKANVINLGSGKTANNVSGTNASGNNTVTSTATGYEDVALGSGKNTVSLGDGENAFTATTGNNTYTGGKDVDTVKVGNGNNTITTGAGNDVISVGGGLNIVSMGAGNDKLSISFRPINGNIFTTVTDINVGDTINLADLTSQASAMPGNKLGSKINLTDIAAFADYLAAATAGVITNAGASTMAWFQFGGNTFIVVDDTNGGSDNNVFENGIDSVVKLTGLVDLSTSTIGTGNAADVLTIVAP